MWEQEKSIPNKTQSLFVLVQYNDLFSRQD